MKENRDYNLTLIADDDVFVRTIIKRGLFGLTRCEEVADGAEVEARYLELKPDVLFLDIHLPNRSGIEIVKSIRNLDPEAYIIMLSADSTEENVKEVMQWGVMGFLTKPFEKERLLHFFNECATIPYKDF